MKKKRAIIVAQTSKSAVSQVSKPANRPFASCAQILHGRCHHFSNPKGIPASNPGLRGTSYPGLLASNFLNSNRIVAIHSQAANRQFSWSTRISHARPIHPIRPVHPIFPILVGDFAKP
jgi:hypothetical protein